MSASQPSPSATTALGHGLSSAPRVDPERLPFLIRPDNVVRYEHGDVLILDRRVYPGEVTFVRCGSCEEVAQAIKDMVTQSEGPGYCAGYGIVQAAKAAADRSVDEQLSAVHAAADMLVATRPTNNHIRLAVQRMLDEAQLSIHGPDGLERALLKVADGELENGYARAQALGSVASEVIADGDQVLTHCWAATGLVYMLLAARDQGKEFAVVCTETRPYLQGARLTADAIGELGIPATIVTDGMPAYLMAQRRVSLFTSGADRVTMDGHIVNKVGTFSIALAAKRHSIPYFPLCYGPDPQAPTASDVPIEERDPEAVLSIGGVRLATLRAGAFYPAFDVTPPDCVTAVLTDRGRFAPSTLADYHRRGTAPEGLRP